MNQAPTEEKSFPYRRQNKINIKEKSHIYKQIKVGLMNQAPTEEKPNQYKRKIHLYNYSQRKTETGYITGGR